MKLSFFHYLMHVPLSLLATLILSPALFLKGDFVATAIMFVALATVSLWFSAKLEAAIYFGVLSTAEPVMGIRFVVRVAVFLLLPAAVMFIINSAVPWIFFCERGFISAVQAAVWNATVINFIAPSPITSLPAPSNIEE